MFSSEIVFPKDACTAIEFEMAVHLAQHGRWIPIINFSSSGKFVQVQKLPMKSSRPHRETHGHLQIGPLPWFISEEFAAAQPEPTKEIKSGKGLGVQWEGAARARKLEKFVLQIVLAIGSPPNEASQTLDSSEIA